MNDPNSIDEATRVLREWISRITLTPGATIQVTRDYEMLRLSPSKRLGTLGSRNDLCLVCDITLLVFDADRKRETRDESMHSSCVASYRTVASGEVEIECHPNIERGNEHLVQVHRRCIVSDFALDGEVQFQEWLWHEFQSIMDHEAKEWFRVDGVPFFNPHPENKK